MKNTVSYFWMLCLCLTISACKEDQQQDQQERIIGDFFVRYLEDTQELKAQATFMEGNSPETATPTSFLGGVSFMNSGMEARQLTDQIIRYELNTKASYPETFVFKFKDDQGETQTYKTSMQPISDFFVEGPVSKSKGMSLVVEGGQLESGQSLVLLFSDTTNQASTIVVQGPSHDIKYAISGPELSNLSLGPVQLYLVKKQQHQTQSANLDFTSAIEYYTATTAFEVVE